MPSQVQAEKNTFQLSVMGLTDKKRYTSTIVNINLASSFVLDSGLKSNYMYWWEEYFTKFQELYDNINAKSDKLESNISTGESLNISLEENFEIGNELFNNILSSISDATVQNNNLLTNNDVAETNYNNLINENSAATANIDLLTSANFDANEILNGVEDIKSYIGYTDSDILGLQIDFENKTFTRLSGAVGLSYGTDFDRFNMFGGRKRCCVADDGTINAWYGDDEYIEDGSNGQVMVYQPKFYYRVVPLKLESIENGIGYHLRKANYYVSDTYKTGFKIHPVFIDKNGEEIDYILFSAYEGSIYDSSENQYITDDAQIMDVENDKLCSIVNVKPASGITQALILENTEQLSQNRSLDWHCDCIQSISATQLLMMIEFGNMNLQNQLGNGIVNISEYPYTDNNSLNTGFISDSDFAPVNYRGFENPWGNMWKFVNKILFCFDENTNMLEAYICSNFNINDVDSFKKINITIPKTDGYISALNYCSDYDYLFLASETLGNSILPIGDYVYSTSLNSNEYYILRHGGAWYMSGFSGAFCQRFDSPIIYKNRVMGCRLVNIPTKNNTTNYYANIDSWRSLYD